MAIKKGLNNYWYLTTNHHSILAIDFVNIRHIGLNQFLQ